MLYKDYLKQVTGCSFCKKDEFSGQIIIENETAALLACLAPYQKHHLLIIPKRHLEKILELSPEEISDINELQNLAIKILYDLNYENMSVLVREGENIGKTVKHLHYHIIPDIAIGAIGVDMGKRAVATKEEILEILREAREIIGN